MRKGEREKESDRESERGRERERVKGRRNYTVYLKRFKKENYLSFRFNRRSPSQVVAPHIENTVRNSHFQQRIRNHVRRQQGRQTSRLVE